MTNATMPADSDTDRRGTPSTGGAAPRPLAELGYPGRVPAGPKPPDADAVLAAALRAEAPSRGVWKTTAQWVAAATITLLLAWLTYSHDGWIPFLSGVDLAIHEFGHLLTFWAPALLCSFAGSFLQVAAPLGLAAYFWWRKDRFAVIVCGAWAAESLNNVSVYVGDAQRMILPLFGDDGSGAGHDWHNILRDVGLLGETQQIAAVVRAASVLLFAIAIGLALWGCIRARRA
jgi:hypothetical protein